MYDTATTDEKAHLLRKVINEMLLTALPMFNMVWMIYLATVKLNYDWLFFIFKSEFWPSLTPLSGKPQT
jgi:hypothetical protein